MGEIEKDFVRIGVEVGEHTAEYENFTKYIKETFDITKVDFILITMKPVEMLERVWIEWAEFFRETKTYFAFLYTQQRGAPKGKDSHLSKELVAKIIKAAGEYFVGDMIGETGGLCSWPEGYYEDIGMEKQYFDSLGEAKDHYVGHVAERVSIDKAFEVPAVLAVEATTLSRYNFQAGADFTFIEMMCGNPEVMFASARGASKAYGKKWWASHVANEWYGGFRNDDPIKYKRLKLAYLMSFISGAKYVYPESGDFNIDSYGYHYDAESKYCKEYRKVWNEFADFVHLHGRPKGGPIAKVGFIQGNLDAWTGWGGSTFWNRFDSEEWTYGDAEYSWSLLDDVYKGEKWHVPTVYGEQDLSFGAPFGQYDIVPVEASVKVLSQYNCLFFVGWNTMTEKVYTKLKEYVHSGGRLFMTAAHLNTTEKRDASWIPVNGGDFSDLFGCRINGKGKRLNWGVKFSNESIIPEYKYPVTKNGNCDPILSSGSIDCADVELTDGKVTAVLADKFFGWREESPAILIEKSYGKGFASIVTALNYPGARGIAGLYKVLLRAAFTGEQEKSNLKVLGNDKLFYSVYPGAGKQYTVYMLNTDYNVPINVRLTSAGLEAEATIKSCGMVIAYVKEDFICIPTSTNVFVEQICENEKGLSIKLVGNSEKEKVRFYTSCLPVSITQAGKEVPFTRKKGFWIINLKINGACEVVLDFSDKKSYY